MNPKRPQPVGYTERQAKQMIERIERQAVKASIAVVELFRQVPDTNQDRAAYLQNQILQASNEIKDIVLRRRR